MIILVGSKIDQSNIQSSLGKPEYSYFFLLKEFLPALEQVGQVISVKSTEAVETLYQQYRAEGQQVVFVSFSPPHQTPLGLECPTVAVFAWEFDSLPALSDSDLAAGDHGDWYAAPENDWRHVFERIAGTIATSRESAALVGQCGTGHFPVIALPAPVWVRYESVCPEQGWSLDVGLRRFEFAGSLIDSRQLRLNAEHYAMRPMSEAARISKVMLRGWWHEVRLPKVLPAPVPVIKAAPKKVTVEVSGVVYTSVFNPGDGRKNWVDLLSAFCWAFRDREDVTLILKMTHHDMDQYRVVVLSLLARLSPFKCRVLVVHGFLDDAQYLQLIQASTFYVNTSSGEGLCIPLMEFLCCGKPAIAPRHTAMADYLSADFAFFVETSQQLTDWPHDPTGSHLTHSRRLNWDSLRKAYGESYAASLQQDCYQELSRQACVHLRNFCSLQRVSMELGNFLTRVLATRSTAGSNQEIQ